MPSSPLQQLREMILAGELAPGERITESELADRLGVSRTPIRNALPALATEGLIEPAGKRGYSVKEFVGEESLNALELRSILEGVAAKRLAENGVPPTVLAELELCLLRGDELFKKHYVTFEDEDLYGQMNERFHRIIVENCGSPMLASFVERLNKVPFIAPSAVIFNQVGLDRAYEILFRAHGQHHAITEAIREGDGARAENLFREHGHSQRQSVFSHIARNKALSSSHKEGAES